MSGAAGQCTLFTSTYNAIVVSLGESEQFVDCIPVWESSKYALIGREHKDFNETAVNATITWDILQRNDQNPAEHPWGSLTLATTLTVPVRELQAVID